MKTTLIKAEFTVGPKEKVVSVSIHEGKPCAEGEYSPITKAESSAAKAAFNRAAANA